VYKSLSATLQTGVSSLLLAANDIKSLQIEYNGQMFPAQPHRCVTGQLILDNAINTGLYFTDAVLEDDSEFKGLGQMMVVQTPKDGTSYATAVGVRATLGPDGQSEINHTKLILCARAPRSLLVRTADSMVVTVQSADVARTDRGLGQAQQAGSGRSGRSSYGSFY
jgi:hypothetical protein